MNLKHTLTATLTGAPFAGVWKRLVRDVVSILMLHRFTDRDVGVDGHSVDRLRADLAFIRRHRIRTVALSDILRGRSAHDPHVPTVAFTIDDGYADFARVAAPVFAEFDCPVTVFVVTGVIDDGSWFWWDRIEYAVDATRRAGVSIPLGETVFQHSLASPSERRAAAAQLTEAAKALAEDDRLRLLRELPETFDVEIPEKPPARYAAMTWDDIRRCVAYGAEFAPHTVTHPILPAVTAVQAEAEIADSWRRVRAECTGAAAPVFCYPNGAFSAREIAILASTDLAAAVTTRPGYLAWQAFSSDDATTRFTLPRFAYGGAATACAQIAGGLERVKLAVRGGRRAWRATGA